MPLPKQVAPLSMAMDSDSGDKYINTSGGVVRERICMRINELDGSSLFNKKLKGNVLVDLVMPSGVNKCIGWCADHKTGSLLWFVYNSVDGIVIDSSVAFTRAELLGYSGTLNGYISDLSEFDGSTGENPYSDYLFQLSVTSFTGTYFDWLSGIAGHSVLRYFVDTDTIQKVWYAQPGLDFQDTFLSACVAEGRVSWVNGTKQPKSFNIEKAVNFTNSLAGEAYLSTDNIESDILPLIKRPPQFSPEVSYTSVVEEAGLPVNFNNLRGKLFQFKYNFVYEDNQESAYSEISKVPLPEGDLTVSGEWDDEFSTNNAIKCNVVTGSGLVRKINIAARIASDLNVGEFNIFKIIDKYDSSGARVIDDNSVYEVTFLNNNNIRNINTEINNRYFDDVPLSANGIVLLNGKYLAFAQPTKNYNEVTADFTLTHNFGDSNFGAATVNMDVQIVYPGRTRTDYKVTIPATATLNSTYRMIVRFGNDDVISAAYNVLSVDPGVEVIRDFLFNTLKSDSRLVSDPSFAKSGTDSILYTIPRSYTAISIKSYGSTIESGSVPSVRSFKRSQYHKVGIVYNDDFGRDNVVNNSAIIFVPSPELKADYGKTSSISYSIAHRPPIQARTYRFVYQKNMSYSYFVDLINVDFVAGGVENIPAGFTFVKINKSLSDYRDFNSKVIAPDYVWVKGDRCRITYQTGAGTSLPTASYEITKPFVRKYMVGETEELEDGFLVDGVVSNFDGLEVFRPNFEFAGNIFYETADSYDILDWGTSIRRHDAGTIAQSADLSTPASGTFSFGDVYMRQRRVGASSGDTMIVEDSSYSDFYLSNSMDKGRPAIEILSGAEQKTLHRVVRSENYIEGSEYNLLNVFLPQTEFFTVSQSYGPITGIAEVGDVLKIIQEHKETSVYIGKASLKQADGTSITVISDKVFNQGNAYDSLHGTKYPRAIAVNERNLYYLDDTTCDLIRSAPNGQESISAFYKMKSYFKSKVEELRASVNYTDIIISIDSLYEEVLVTFINGSSSETIAFYEKEGQKGFTWKAQIKPVSGVPDNFAWYGDRLFSFLSGKLWKHDVGTDTSFYGDRKPCSVSFIVNAGAGDANKFSDIEMSSPDNIWDVVFNIAAGSNYPVQKTILKPAIIREKENRLYSGILRNILGRNNTEDVSKLRNGSQMTGETMLVTISNNTAGDYILKEVEVKFLTSK